MLYSKASLMALAVTVLCSSQSTVQVSSFSILTPSKRTPTSLGVSMVSSFIDPSYQPYHENDKNNNNKSSSSSSSSAVSSTKLSRPERKKMERAIKKSRKTGIYPLDSNRISELNVHTSTYQDVMIAIKRAQNLHHAQDIQTIGRFLLEGIDDTFAYGYKGSLLARFAVAALRCHQYDVAQQALDYRSTRLQDSILPYESAAIVRGWNRANQSKKAFEVLEQELSMPTFKSSSTMTTEQQDLMKDIVKYRALSLAAIASRHFYENQPLIAIKACQMLIELSKEMKTLGFTIRSSSSTEQEQEFDANDSSSSPHHHQQQQQAQVIYMDIPWKRIEEGALQCTSPDAQETNCASIVHTTMKHFPPPQPTWEDTLKDIMEQSTSTTTTTDSK